MRIAILSDIHGNLAALEAALAAVERLRVDELVIAGDIVNGAPDSAACWERVKALRCPVLRGNHERYVYDSGAPHAPVEWSTPQFGPVHYSVATLTAEQRDELRALPTTWKDERCPGLLVVHASLRNDQDLVYSYTGDEAIDAMFPRLGPETLIVRAHNHIQAVRLWRGRQIVTAGSVGLTLDGQPSAQFVVVERRDRQWTSHHHAVRYDVEATVRRFRETHYAERAGPIGRLFEREVATGTHQILPFLRFIERARKNTPGITLADALPRFLGPNEV